MSRCEAVRENGHRCLLVAHDESTPHVTIGKGGWVSFGTVRCSRCYQFVDASLDAACHAADCDGAA